LVDTSQASRASDCFGRYRSGALTRPGQCGVEKVSFIVG
jgi:hypothetical protein